MSFDVSNITNYYHKLKVSIPLEQGNVFRHKGESVCAHEIGFNPFGTGQCLSTAAGCSSLVWQGFPEPLPNFF